MRQSFWQGTALALLLTTAPALAWAQDAAADDQDFVTQAAQSNVNEVAFGRAALERGQNPDVKVFADRMVKDHTQANTELAAVAGEAGFTLPEEVDDARQQELDQLAESSGPEFDRAYIESQIAAHQEAIDLFTEQASQTPAGALETWAAETLPKLEDHLAMAQQIADSLDSGEAMTSDAGQPAGTATMPAETGPAMTMQDDSAVGTANGQMAAADVPAIDQATGQPATVVDPTAPMVADASQCQADIAGFNEEVTGSLSGLGGGIDVATREEVRSLVDAARVFAANGNEQGCQMILGQIRETFTEGTSAFQAANPDMAVYETEWNDMLAAAVPLAEYSRLLRADDLVGSDVRNPQNVDIGDIQDVIFDPADGSIAFVLLDAGGGFLGIGDSFVPVPWSALHITTDGTTYVVNMSEDEMAAAPTITVDDAVNAAAWKGDVDDWWARNINQPG